MFEKFFAIICMAIVIEGTVTYLKTLFVDRRFQWQVALAIVLGVATAWAYQLSIFDILGLQAKVQFISYILTGILMSRGSNYIFDFIEQLQNATKGE